MSSPRKPNVKPKSLLHKRYLGTIFVAMATTLTVVGCDSKDQTNPESPVKILENEIVVDDSMVYTSAPERYQPSYNLQGALQLITNTEVTTSYPVLEASIKVKEGDKVEQGQALAEIKSKVTEDKIPFIVNEFLEVYVNGKQITQESAAALTTANGQTKNLVTLTDADLPNHQKPTSTDINDANRTNNSPSKEANNKTAKLIAVTLVLKSPVDGIITNVSNTSDTSLNSKPLNSKLDSNSATQSESDTDSDSKTKQNKVNDERVNTDNNKPKAVESNQNSVVITVANPHKLQLIGTLPLTTQSQLSVGKPVYFTVHELHKEFTGQISHITPDPESDTLTVRAPLVAGENSQSLLKPGMKASMSIEYGQTELGVRLPREAIHEASLVQLNKNNSRPNSPLKGYVWIIEQDQTLSYTPIEVVEYFAESDKFLVSGINNESLVCLADLPKTSIGKKISVD